MSRRTQGLAADLARAHRERAPVTLPADLTLDEAYALQDLVFGELSSGARAVAWKVGGPGGDATPTVAQILPGRLYGSPARVPTGGFAMIGIEAEVGFRFTCDAKDDVSGAAGEAVVTIEICDSRLADWKGATPAAKLADFQSNAALVVGSGTARWRDIDFRAQRAELWVNGKRVREARGAHPYGEPASLLPAALEHCATRGGLRAGDVVTTGSWTGMEFVSPGAEVRAVFPGIGEAVVHLEVAT